MNPYDNLTDAQRIRDVVEWECSDGRDYVWPTTAGYVVAEAVTETEREAFRRDWEQVQAELRIEQEALQR